MKKVSIMLMCFILTVSLCSCSEEKPPDEDLFVTLSQAAKDSMSALSPSNYKDLDGNVLAKRITFKNIANFLCVNTNHDTEENHTITICGKYLKTDDLKLLEQRILELVEEVSLYSGDELIFSSSSLEWSFKKVEKGIDFAITIPVTDQYTKEGPVCITRLAIKAGKTEFIKDCECFYIIPYNNYDEEVKVVEVPETPKDSIYKGSKLMFSYYIAVNNIEATKKIDAKLLIVQDCKKYIDNVHTSVTLDNKRLQYFRENPKIDQTKLQDDKVQLYKLTVECEIIKGFRVGFQPLIQLMIGNQEHIVAPFSMLDLHIN